LVALLPGVNAPLTVVLGALVLVSAALPLAFTLATGVLVGSLPAAVGGGLDSPAWRDTLRALALTAAVFVLIRLVGPLRGIAAALLGQQVQERLEERVMGAVSAPTGVGHLEDPATLDRIAAAQEVGTARWRPAGAVEGLASLLPLWLQSLGYALVLSGFRWWLGLAVLAAQLYAMRVRQREFLRTAQVLAGDARLLRRAAYYRDLALIPPAAKEVRLFGLPDWLSGRYADAWRRTMAPLWHDRDRGLRGYVGAVLLQALVQGGALAYVGWAAAQGRLSLGALTVLVGAVAGLRALDDGLNDVRLAWGAAALPAVLDLERRLTPATGRAGRGPEERESPEGASGVPAGAGRRTGIRFEGVTFRYPERRADALVRLDLDIPAGQSLAIVGENGAGKTTLVKLLCRLYEPEAGRITADGADLRGLDAAAWRRRVAVIFQDFVHYELPARDNVGFGSLGALSGPGAAERLEAAAQLAGALDLIRELPRGWETVLSRRFTGGADLSGGEWQRIALARALFAVAGGADVLILDEPTANLDVRAEAALYERFLDLTRGLTTILISHRFATVRRADRICVLAGGEIVEDGTHAALLARGGRYAALFRLQAARFADGPRPREAGASAPRPAAQGSEGEGG
jgi:ABC-type multidrug transport system fused ATPase/permease subunit